MTTFHRPSLALRSALLGLVVAASLLGGCASASRRIYWPSCEPAATCKPAGTVILLPEKDGQPSAVQIHSDAGNGLLSKPYQTAETNGQGSIQLAETNAEAVGKRYPWLLSLRPPEPQHLTLYFTTGKPQLTSESEAQMQTLLAFIAKWPGSEVMITAHTDTTGSPELNDKLSLERASALCERLISHGLRAELVQAVGRGEHELAVPTADNVDEPRNRRADILVR